MDINFVVIDAYIQVRKKTIKGSEEEFYETELAQLFSEEDEVGFLICCLPFLWNLYSWTYVNKYFVM